MTVYKLGLTLDAGAAQLFLTVLFFHGGERRLEDYQAVHWEPAQRLA
jgi:hypothetical protein